MNFQEKLEYLENLHGDKESLDDLVHYMRVDSKFNEIEKLFNDGVKFSNPYDDTRFMVYIPTWLDTKDTIKIIDNIFINGLACNLMCENNTALYSVWYGEFD